MIFIEIRIKVLFKLLKLKRMMKIYWTKVCLIIMNLSKKVILSGFIQFIKNLFTKYLNSKI